MRWKRMNDEELELIREVVRYANNVGYDYDMRVEITEEQPDYVKVRTINDEDETDMTATVRVLGDYSYVDCDENDQGGRVDERTVHTTLLGVWIDGESSTRRWRVIDARATSLFSMLYI